MEVLSPDTSFKGRRGQGGQAVVEYILLLVIIIALVLGAGYQFNDAFKQWANNYFGEYLTCLLETGELPAIGGTGGAASSCAGQFKEFSLADGRPYEGGPGGSSGGSPNGGSPNGNSANPDDSDNDDSDSTKGGGGAGEMGGGSGGRRSKGSGEFSAGGSNGRFAVSGGADGEGQSARSKKGSYTGSTEDSIPGGAISGGRSGSSQKRRQLDGAYFVSKEKRPDEGLEKPLVKIASEGSRIERKQLMIIKRKPATASSEIKDEPMSFGDYFRYFLIAALIIAIVVVLGGQLAQISNEME